MRTIARVGIALAGMLSWSSLEARAQTTPGSPTRGGQEYHIEVNTLPGCFFYGCEEAVRAGNVRVTAAGVRVPVRVTQPWGPKSGSTLAPPVHVLVAFAPGVKRPSDAQLMANLKHVLAVGWLVSVCRADGTFTDYAHEADLRRALGGHSDAPIADAGLDTISAAVAGLRSEPGYRVVLIDLGGRPDEKFVRWLASEADRLSPIYVSDGGKAQMPYSASAGEGFGTSASPLGSAGNKKERAYTDGVFHELKLAEAIDHALADARYDYDVRFRAPASVASDAPVKLTFLDPGTHLPYELRTDLYVIEMRELNGKLAHLRADATSRLTTVEK